MKNNMNNMKNDIAEYRAIQADLIHDIIREMERMNDSVGLNDEKYISDKLENMKEDLVFDIAIRLLSIAKTLIFSDPDDYLSIMVTIDTIFAPDNKDTVFSQKIINSCIKKKLGSCKIDDTDLEKLASIITFDINSSGDLYREYWKQKKNEIE